MSWYTCEKLVLCCCCIFSGHQKVESITSILLKCLGPLLLKVLTVVLKRKVSWSHLIPETSVAGSKNSYFSFSEAM